jgi:hypothetical protein
MNTAKALVFFVLVMVLSSCEQRFPMDKRYWTPTDYKNVIFEIQYKTPKGEEYPRFSNPETAEVIRKLTDPQNYEVILDDPELGLNYKNKVSQEFFDQYQKMNDPYGQMDVQDKYVYPEELIAIAKFVLGFQIKYFSLGNEVIKSQSDSPESSRTQNILSSNEQTIIQNFGLYLDLVKDEKHFSSHAHLLADGITTHFFKLIETFPNANYDGMRNKASALATKTEVPEIKAALTNLVNKLESIKKPI